MSYPKSWKGYDINGELKSGRFLVNHYGAYILINAHSAYDAFRISSAISDPYVYANINMKTLQWECSGCGHFNSRSLVKCEECKSVLDKFKGNVHESK